MRRVVAELFYSIDGVVESPDTWSPATDEVWDEELNADISRQDDVLLGRVTYEEWAAFWPTAQFEPFAGFINNVRKHVATRTLTKLEWNNSHLLGPDVVAAVRKLKEGPGRDIGVHGSIRLQQSLIRAGLVDELVLWVTPNVSGQGLRRLFEPGEPKREMKLVRSRVSPNGIAILRYSFAGS